MEVDELYKTRDCIPNCSQDEMEYLYDMDEDNDLDFDSKIERNELLSEVGKKIVERVIIDLKYKVDIENFSILI